MTTDNPHLQRVLNIILDALDELMSHSLDATTRQQMAVEERRLSQIIVRAQLILSVLADKRATTHPRVFHPPKPEPRAE